MSSRVPTLVLAGALLASATACGRSDLEVWTIPVPIFDASAPDARDATPHVDVTKPPCVPGAQVSCTCPGGTLGVTVCLPDGGQTACTGCPDLDATPPIDTGVDAACSPGSHDCVGETPEVCSAAGQWVLEAMCTGDTPLCADGMCVACSPGTLQCMGMTPQICTTSGAWQDEAPCAQPTPDCMGGVCACIETMCGSSCVDLTSDPKNCGACGHSCLGGGCMDSACEPIVVATVKNIPLEIATDSTYIYWTDDAGNVLKTPITGGDIVTLASAPAGPATGLAVSSATAYWSVGTDVLSVPSGGGTSTTIATTERGGLAIDATNVYWGTYDALERVTLQSQPLAGGATTTLATLTTGQAPIALAADGTSVYVEVLASPKGIILSVPRGGGTATTLSTLPEPSGAIAAGGGEVYWTQGDPSFALPLNSTVVALTLSGPDAGAPNVVANAQSDVGPIVTDNVSVFWANNCGVPDKPCGSVLTLSPSSPEIRVLASAQSTVNGIAVDADRVFWTSYDSMNGVGSIIWVAK